MIKIQNGKSFFLFSFFLNMKMLNEKLKATQPLSERQVPSRNVCRCCTDTIYLRAFGGLRVLAREIYPLTLGAHLEYYMCCSTEACLSPVMKRITFVSCFATGAVKKTERNSNRFKVSIFVEHRLPFQLSRSSFLNSYLFCIKSTI